MPLAQVASHVYDDADRYRETFLNADPFRHVAIDEFFELAFAERLLAEFPSFDSKLAKNEHGGTGRKAVNTSIREISPTYQEVYATISSAPFLQLVSRLSGIPDLILDPKLYGGGTHENLHGQELDPHVDFNYDESQQLHRRLNLIVYLNKGWREEWGGSIEIHSNPRRPKENRIKSYLPSFNRCVMFETNEYSWHGFPRINLPPEMRHLSRKSLSIYLYTKDRATHEIVPMHGTFYVQRPLPAQLASGAVLAPADLLAIENLLIRRDSWIEHYQQAELKKNGEIAEKAAYIRDLLARARLPLAGYIAQRAASGYYPDGWAASHLKCEIQPLQPVTRLTLDGTRADWQTRQATLRVRVNGELRAETQLTHGAFSLPIHLPVPLTDAFSLDIICESVGDGGKNSADDRDLAFLFYQLTTTHTSAEERQMRACIESLRAELAEKNTQLAERQKQFEQKQAELTHEQHRAPAPATGPIIQDKAAEGFYWDRWIGPESSVVLRPLSSVAALELRGWRPPEASGTLSVSVSVNGRVLSRASAGRDQFVVLVPLPEPVTEPFEVQISTAPSFCPKNPGQSEDNRDLAFVLLELRAVPPSVPFAKRLLRRLRS